jgi:hypothetical protein
LRRVAANCVLKAEEGPLNWSVAMSLIDTRGHQMFPMLDASRPKNRGRENLPAPPFVSVHWRRSECPNGSRIAFKSTTAASW